MYLSVTPCRTVHHFNDLLKPLIITGYAISERHRLVSICTCMPPFVSSSVVVVVVVVEVVVVVVVVVVVAVAVAVAAAAATAAAAAAAAVVFYC